MLTLAILLLAALVFLTTFNLIELLKGAKK
jgi:hypothetical protein